MDVKRSPENSSTSKVSERFHHGFQCLMYTEVKIVWKFFVDP